MTQLTIQQALDLALQRHRSGQLQEAEELYRQVLAEQPDHSRAMLYLGVIANQTGRKEIAVDLIRRAIVLRPNDAEAHCNLGNVLKDLGQLDEAVAACRRAIALQPSYAEAHNNLGSALHLRGQFEEAIAAYRQAIAVKPQFAEAHYNLGNALRNKGQHDEAIAAYRQAIALNPNLSEAHIRLGHLLKEKGQPDGAIAAFRRAIALNTKHAGAHVGLGTALRDKGQLDEAIAAYRQGIALRPNYAEAHYMLGIALKYRQEFDEPIAAFRQAIALRPNFPEAFVHLGLSLMDKGELDEAIAAFRRAIVLRPNFADAQNNLVNALHLNPVVDAKAVYRQILAEIPNAPDALHSLGALAAHLGQPEQAIELFAGAIDVNPNEARYYDSQGKVYKALKRIPQAVACLERAIQLRPDWDEARCRLSSALMEQSELTPPTCRISYVIASRNDTFCGNPMDRLRIALQHVIDVAMDYEVIVADWGSDIPIFEIMKTKLPATGNIRFLHIPPNVTRRFNMPFSEVHALNAAIRRSRGIFVGRIDQDTLIGQRFVVWAAHILQDDDLRAYHSIRRELPPGVFTIQRDAPIWGGLAADGPGLSPGPIGIVLAPRRLWHWTRGYDERLLFRNYMENGLCQRFASLTGLRNLGAVLDCDFYHIWHARVAGARVNESLPIAQLAQEAKRNPRLNDENWGLGDCEEQITQSVL